MSGGHFEYRQHTVRDLAESVHSEAGKLLIGEEAPEVVARVLMTAKLLRAAGEALHALDWWLSSDTNSVTFSLEFDKAMRNLDDPLLPERTQRTIAAIRSLS